MKKQSFTHSRKPKFGMRKLSIGLASCMLGMMFLTTGHVSGEVVEVWPNGQNPNGKIEILSQTEHSEHLQKLRDIEDFQAQKQADHVRYTKWLDGVTVDEHEFRKIKEYDTEYYVTPLLSGKGYYDINKDFNQDSDKCAAAVAANMFHYWFDRNRDSINRFLSQSPGENGVIKLENEKTIEVSKFLETYRSDGDYLDKSPFFDLISNSFKGPVWANKLLDAYINGYGYIHKFAKNTPHSKNNNSKFNFFK
ncbi:TPA: IdeS/Mac family cysteine endopeptidase, partial [Streptococcus equi subsp. equi]|nr:IdeS/Mac family cysteine endopeptidase [Streptococcus equi subsp. equi]HEL1452480.1 IdeS/Mac family cysteine endopeptidase [Streptococcus equi subsp. equi]